MKCRKKDRNTAIESSTGRKKNGKINGSIARIVAITKPKRLQQLFYLNGLKTFRLVCMYGAVVAVCVCVCVGYDLQAFIRSMCTNACECSPPHHHHNTHSMACNMCQ